MVALVCRSSLFLLIEYTCAVSCWSGGVYYSDELRSHDKLIVMHYETKPKTRVSLTFTAEAELDAQAKYFSF